MISLYSVIFFLSCSCRVDGDAANGDTSGSDTSGDTASNLGPGILRLGPPAPAVGAYGVAAYPGHDRVYVTNLHVPWITIVDPETGAWSGGIDLRLVGIEKTNFPRVYLDGETLWVVNLEMDEVVGFDMETLEPVVPAALAGTVSASRMIDDVLWIATTEGEVLQVEGGDVVARTAVKEAATALYAEQDLIALVYQDAQEVLGYDRSGSVLWEVSIEDPLLEEVVIAEGRTFVAARQSGDVLVIENGEVNRWVNTGSDTFGLTRHEDLLLVANRQGAALPESGSYEGDPGVVTALNFAMEPVWSVALSKTLHFLAWDGSLWWTVNEDSLVMSAVDPETGTVAIEGPRIGVTLDHLEERGSQI